MVTTGREERLRTWVVTAPEAAIEHELLDRLGRQPSAASAAPLRHGYAADGPERGPAGAPSPVARLVVEAGPDAGRSCPLPPGTWVTVGRDASCDLPVEDSGLSRRHVRVRHGRDGFEVEDLGSTNGVVREDGTRGHRWTPGTALHAGDSRLGLRVAPDPPLQGRTVDGRLEVRPWPRVAPDVPHVQLDTPAPPERRSVPPLSAWSWALPLLAAGAGAAVLRMPLLLVFGLLGPVMVLGQYRGARRHARLEHEDAVRRWEAATAALRAAADQALQREREARRLRDPGVGVAALSVLPHPAPSLWCRSGEPPTVVLGEGTDVSSVAVDGRALPIDRVPVTLDLDEPVAVIGPAETRDAAVRAWVLQLALWHPPGTVSIGVDGARPPRDWDLLAWLPHTRTAASDRRARHLRWGHDLVLVDEVRDAPPGMTRVWVRDDRSATLQRPGLPERHFTPTLLRRPLARLLARRLAGLHDRSERPGIHVAAPALGDLLPWPRSAADASRTWADDPRLAVPLGTRDGVPVVVDLATDGPHALVAGTTGAGKSELLRALVTGLALLNPPSRLSVLLLDYKGGSSLAECARLPHSTGLVTDLDGQLAERVLVSLRAELTRRERVLAGAGVPDVRHYRGNDVPRLVVVVDEFRVLAEEVPEFLDGLVRVAAVGRSLGLHLVLATQRPGGIVSADLRANVNLRIALRVRDVADSADVLECSDAAHLPEGRPGLALMRTGSDRLRTLQVAPVGPPAGAPSEHQWAVREVTDVWEGWRVLNAPTDRLLTAPVGLGQLPELLHQAAAQTGGQAAAIWLPPLPPTVRVEDTAHAWPPTTDRTARPWALVDRPDRQRREVEVWDVQGHVGVIGAPRAGRTTALLALAASAGDAWFYVLDLGRGMEGSFLDGHHCVRAWVGPGDRAHGLRVVEVLSELVDERLSGGDRTCRPVVLLVDGWDRLVEQYAEHEGGRAVDLVLRLLREGPAARISVAVSGDRSLLTGRAAAQLASLWALHLHDPADLALAGIPTPRQPVDRPPGRLLRTRDGVVAQVVLPPADAAQTKGAADPHEVAPPEVRSLPVVADPGLGWAVGGDRAAALRPPDGSVLVVGPPGSGVSTVLRSLAAPAVEPCPSGAPHGTAPLVVRGDDRDHDTLMERLDRGVATVVVDDVHLLAGTTAEDLVLAWAARTGGRLLVGGDLDACANHYRGLVPHVARLGTGVVLHPSSPQHGALLGVRLPVGDLRVPGRGVLVDRGRCTRIQVAGP